MKPAKAVILTLNHCVTSLDLEYAHGLSSDSYSALAGQKRSVDCHDSGVTAHKVGQYIKDPPS